MPSLALHQLDGYEFVSRIGRGAGATISLVVETATKREVALKHVLRRNADDDRYIAQAETEYEIGHQLDHPHLRKYYSIMRVRRWLKVRHLYLLMEYIDGVRLEDRRPQDLLAAVSIFARVAEGLHAMHVAGFAHADIKPNNILLGKDGGVKIIDFGQSCPLGTAKKRLQGTPDYIAPEQVLRQKIDQRTDVFNLGATMYWVLTGKYFKTMIQNAPTGAKRIHIEAKRGNDPPHELNPAIPVALSRLVIDCCENSPDRRPRDMKEYLARLDLIRHLVERMPSASL